MGIEKILANAIKYPLHVRIATRLHLAGVSAEDFAAMKLPMIEEPMTLRVRNSLRDIESGWQRIDDTLRILSEDV